MGIMRKNIFRKGKRLVELKRYFTKKDQDVFSTVDWKTQDIIIKDNNGNIIFECKDADFPSTWSDNSCRIVASKYFSKHPQKKENSVMQLITRVVNRIAEFSKEYFDEFNQNIFRDELSYILLHQYACFNSPVWFNLGIKDPGDEQTSACFILDLQDNMQNILKCQVDEVMIAKSGSGSGVVNSNIRSKSDIMTSGGNPSGPISFMEARDSWANIILSGGVLRRFAKMEILHYDHPDIMDFINVKKQEEEKLLNIGSEYKAKFQNSNFSVRVDRKFWDLIEDDGEVICKYKDGSVAHKYKARFLLRKIAEGTHRCGDPGMQFEDRMYDSITVSGDQRQIGTNPCSEYIWYPNTSCNLASINIKKVLKENSETGKEIMSYIDVHKLEFITSMMTIAMDLLVHNSSYPTEEIKQNTSKYRNLGLGFSNLGASLLSLAIPYDSENGRYFATCIQAIIQYNALYTSTFLAKHFGHAEGFDLDKQTLVLNAMVYYLNLEKLNKTSLHSYLFDKEIYIHDEDSERSIASRMQILLEKTHLYGLRNCQSTTVAPCGTISFMMDCDTTGIEPVLFLKQIKNVVDGYKMVITIFSVISALKLLGYSKEDIQSIEEYIQEHGTVYGCDIIKQDHLNIFKTSLGDNSIEPEGHIRMCSAVQPFVNGGISKTINAPSSITVEEIEDLYKLAYKSGMKCVAIYRDGSKATQVLETSDKKKTEVKSNRRKLPDTCLAKRHKFSIDGNSGFIHYTCYPGENKLGEIFITMSREGSTLGGLLDSFAASISIGLQYGVPLEVYIEKFINTRFVPSGWTSNKEIRMESSIIDYIFRFIADEFGLNPGSNNMEVKEPTEKKHVILDGPPCGICGGLTYQSGTCDICSNCGETTGCG